MKKQKILSRIFGIGLVLVLVTSVLGGLTASVKEVHASPGTIWVPDNYSTIQAAVDNATSGDTIIVRDGIYNENVDVGVASLTIQSENGTANCIVTAANPNNHIFNVAADWVNITGLTVQNATGNGKAGIYLGGAEHCGIFSNNATNNYEGIRLDGSCNNTLMNNTVLNNTWGIRLSHSSNNTLTNNNASNNDWDGIYLDSSSNNIIANNTVSNNNVYGIGLYYSSHNTITNNNVSNNDGGVDLYSSINNTLTNNTMVNGGIFIWGNSLEHWNTHTIDTSNQVNGKPIYYWKNKTGGKVPAGAGQVILANCTQVFVENQNITNVIVAIKLGFSNDNTITSNTVNWSNTWCGVVFVRSCGIGLDYSSHNTITNNNASNNNWDGIYLDSSSNNIITNNTISNNIGHGISLDSSSNNIIANNTVSNHNINYGIWLSDSSSNTIYRNNFINNTGSKVASSSPTNTWNSTEQITYTYKGTDYTNYLGNYWSDYAGSDLDGDGIGNSPYLIANDNNDTYPLIASFENYGMGPYNLTMSVVGSGTTTPAVGNHTYDDVTGKWIYYATYEDPIGTPKYDDVLYVTELEGLGVLLEQEVLDEVGVVTDTVTTETYKTYADICPDSTRDVVLPMEVTATIFGVDIWNSVETRDFVRQLAYTHIDSPLPADMKNYMDYFYFETHGWPYVVGAIWNYTLQQITREAPVAFPPVHVDRTAEVVGDEDVTVTLYELSQFNLTTGEITGTGNETTFNCTYVKHFEGAELAYEEWRNDTVGTAVKMIDHSQFKGVETRTLAYYSSPSFPVVVTATPAAGWRFDRWSGDLNGTMNPTTIIIDSHKSVTAHFRKKARGKGGGGGGGGGYYYLSVSMLGNALKYRINQDGNLEHPIEVCSEDGRVTVSLDKDTACLDNEGKRLENIWISETYLPQLPEGYYIIGEAYGLEPSGAIFDPAFNLTLGYEDNIPQYVSEEGIYIAYYDVPTGIWIPLSSQVDTQNNTVTAPVSHFTTFAVMGEAIPPAEFTITSLDVSSEQVKLGEPITISTEVTNIGGSEGSYTVNLTINGEVEQTKTVTLAPEATETVTFIIIKGEPGSYSASIGGWTEEFIVTASWLSRYWWTVVIGIVAAGLLVYFLVFRRKRAHSAA